MRVIEIDDDGAFVTKGGAIQWLEDAEAVAQLCTQVMRTRLGEYSYDQTKGIDYFGNVFLDNVNLQKFEAESREQLEAIEGVTKVASFDYSLDDGVLTYEAYIETEYGTGVTTSGSI